MDYIDPLDRRRLQRGIEHLYHLGPRVGLEFVLDLVGRIGGLPAAIALLTEYERRLTLTMVRLAGADRFVPHLQPAPRDLGQEKTP